MKHNDNNKFYL